MSSDDAQERISRRYRVSGHVQSVGFRWFVREQARALGIAGLVRNQPDGTVFVDVLASLEQLARLEAVLRRGPPGAHVERVDIEPAGAEPGPAGRAPFPFAIARGE
jgi:acylphosphatase